MKSTTDLWFASYIMSVKGIPLENFELINVRRGKFIFKVEESEWKKLKLDFHNSDISKCKHGQEKLKDLLY